ncbi:MAG: restriction endonuclease subunit S [Aphanizomenon gracile PMC638.10]|nr:restriction endonuclease subunit S [Aphanizomenon gracile PMC638.10]
MKTKLVLLGEYVKVVGGYAFKSENFSDEGIPVIRISDIQDGSVCLDKAARIPKTLVGKGENYYINPGDILIAMSGATTGKIGVVPHNFNDFILQNQRVGNFKIIDSEQVDKRYLKHFVSSPSYQNQIWKSMVGVAQPNISSKQLENFEITFPALEEQKRIAEILDQAEELRTKRREAIAQLDTLTQSIFIEMFGDPVRNPKEWVKMPFGEVCVTRLGKMLDKQKQTGEYRRMYLRNANVQWFRFNLTDIFEMDFRASECEILRLQYGDLLICEGGEPGRAAIWRDEIPECYYQKTLHRARPKHDLANSEYLAYLLWLLSKGGGLNDHITSSTISHLTGEKLKVMKIPIPPIDLQQKFAHRIEAVEKLKASHRASLSELDALFTSLQHRAFRGEL